MTDSTLTRTGQGQQLSKDYKSLPHPAMLVNQMPLGAYAAEVTEARSSVRRALASGLPMPIGFKNAPDGDVQAAVDACRCAAERNVITVMSPRDGTPAVTRTAGNPDCHVVLRGGRWGPNYQSAHVGGALAMFSEAGLPRRVMVDASHGNSGKDHNRQPLVARAVAEAVRHRRSSASAGDVVGRG